MRTAIATITKSFGNLSTSRGRRSTPSCCCCYFTAGNSKATMADRAKQASSKHIPSMPASLLPPLLGGDHAGYHAEFSAKDGSLLPIPSRFVPDELIMWGQSPKCWEVLISEGLGSDLDSIVRSKSNSNVDSNSNSDSKTSFQRNTTTVLPGVGCGLDSLDTIVSTEVYHWNNCWEANETNENESSSESSTSCTSDNDNAILRVWYDETEGVAILDALLSTQSEEDAITPAVATSDTTTSSSTTTTTKTFRLETLFALPTKDHRLRVTMDVSATCQSNNKGYRYELSSSRPIRTHWERRYDVMAENDSSLRILSSNFNDDLNGHLDAGTVFGLIGEDLRRWRSDITEVPLQPDPTNETEEENIVGVVLLKLPKHLSIASGPMIHHPSNGSKEAVGWYLEIGLDCPSLANTEDHSEDKNNFRIPTVRREFKGFDCTVMVPS